MSNGTPDPGQLFLFERPGQDTPQLSLEIRNNFTALAQTNYTTDAQYPSAPKIGMVRIFRDPGPPANVKQQWFDGVTWQDMLQKLEGGVAAPSKIIVDVNVPQTVWTVDHNLGSQPLVQVFDNLWRQLEVLRPGTPLAPSQYYLEHPTENRIIVTHPSAIVGHIVIVG